MLLAEKSQTFNFPADRCYEGLLQVFPRAGIKIQAQDPAARTVRGLWSHPGEVGARSPMEAACDPAGDNSTTVRLMYSPDVPKLLQKISRSSKMVTERMDQVFALLTDNLKDPEAFARAKPESRQTFDMIAAVSGTVVALGLRVLFVLYFVDKNLYQYYHMNLESEARTMMIAGVVAAGLGALVAGAIKRRDPALASATVEGLAVGVANALFFNSLCGAGVTYKASLTATGWALHIGAGLLCGWLGSLRRSI